MANLVPATVADANPWRNPQTSNPLRVLVVDDEASVRSFVDRVLKSAGYETVVAPDGPTALQLAETKQHFDLLLTDLKMPQMNGDELARQLRQSEPALKVLYFTGFSDMLFAQRLALWDEEVFLDKPASVNGLLQAVRLLCTGHTT